MSHCDKCGGVIKKQKTLGPRDVSIIRSRLTSALSTAKRMYQISSNQKNDIDRIAKLQEAYGIFEMFVSDVLRKLE